MAAALSYQATADSWITTTTQEFRDAMRVLYGRGTASTGHTDTIFINPASPDEVFNTGTSNWWETPTAGTVYIIGMPTDFRPILITTWDLRGTEPGSDLSLIFENLHLQHPKGATGTSGQIFCFTRKYIDIDTLAFRNCEVSNYPRTFFRSGPPETTGKDDEGNDITIYEPGGTIAYFEMSDCVVHNANLTSGNRWPCVYFGHTPIELVFRNNTFYDLPYLKCVYTMNKISDEAERFQVSVYFEHNTLMVGAPNDFKVFEVSDYLGIDSQFFIENNLFLYPDWVDDFTLEQTGRPKILSSVYGMVYAYNNVIEGYNDWESGNAKDENGEYTWMVADTTDNYTMADVELNWDDFYDRTNKDFSLLKSHPLYTAGKDAEGNVTYIGDGRWYVDEFPVKASVNVTLEGSTTATLTVQPEKTFYVVGDQITLSIDLHDGLNTFVGWSDGVTEMNRTITLTGDLDLTANVVSQDYEVLWDFCQLKDGSSGLDLPFAANHAADPENNPGKFGIMTVEHSADGVTYADTTYSQTRNNKTYPYNGSEEPVLFMAALLRTHLDEAKVDEQTAAAGYKEELTGDCGSNPSYAYIEFSTKGMTDVKVSSVILAEARMYKTTKLEYSLDKINWNTLTTVSIDSVAGAWHDCMADLPAAADNQDVVYVRWIGDATSPILGPGMDGADRGENDEMLYRKYYTYQFIGNIKVSAVSEGSAIEEVQTETTLIVAQTGNQVTVSNVDVATVDIYAVNGVMLAREAVINGTVTIVLPAHGVYYIKAGKEIKSVVY